MVAVPLAAGAVAVAVLSDRNPVVVFVLVALTVAAAGAIGTYMLANRRARSAFIVAWARSRGWTEGAGPWRESATPLLRKGDRHESEDEMWGPLPGGGEAVLCHYTFEVEQQATDSHGNTTTTWEPHPFTIVETGVTAPAIPRLTLHPRSFGDNRLFDQIDSKVTSDRVVQLESSELNREFKLEVADETSDLAVRMLFEPAFIVWCLDEGAGTLVEIENETLVVAIPDHSYDGAELDSLLDKATTIAARVAEAHAATTQGAPT